MFGGLAAPATGGLPPAIQGSVGCGCVYESGAGEGEAGTGPVLLPAGDEGGAGGGRHDAVLHPAPAAVAALLRAAGIEVDLQKLEVRVLVDRQAKGTYDLSLGEVGSVSPTVGDIFGLGAAHPAGYSACR